MKIALVGIASKYIHANTGIRLLKANTIFPVELYDVTIKDSVSSVINMIQQNDYDLLGLSVYIWNVEWVKQLILKLHQLPNTPKLLLGGPEVSYEYDEWFDLYGVDFIIRNEGEEAFHLLLEALSQSTSYSSIPNLVYKHQNKIVSNKLKTVDTSQLQSPHQFEEDIPYIKTKIHYMETSRGCPYNCAYCMASLESSIRYLDLNQVMDDIKYLVSHGARTIKFLDRTFNVNQKYVKTILSFISQYESLPISFQFEVVADILSDDMIDFIHTLPKNLVRFEIGIQSIHEKTALSVNRIQNTPRLLENILVLQNKGVVDLHLDLIAGLPYETYPLFQTTFDTVFSIYPKELQLGFLKMLKGTSLRNHASKWGYVFDKIAPYQIIENQFITKEELHLISLAENVLDRLYNSGELRELLLLILQTKQIKPYQLFESIGLYLKHINFTWIKSQIDQVYQAIHSYIIDTFNDNESLVYELKKQYLLRSKTKPKIWWEKSNLKHAIIPFILPDIPEQADTLYRYATIIESSQKTLVVIYQSDKRFYEMDKHYD